MGGFWCVLRQKTEEYMAAQNAAFAARQVRMGSPEWTTVEI